MKKNEQIIISALGLVLIYIGGSAIYKKYISMTKEQAMKIISVASKEDLVNLAKQGDQYLIERAKAIKSGAATFVYEGKTYETKTGKVKTK